jgi:hypothetical protein
MEIKQVTVMPRNPSGDRGDLGSCEVGYYTESDGLLTMVSGTGEPLRGANGERITARLEPGGESERAVAMRLTLGHWRATSDDDPNGFNRPLRYSKAGLA